MPTIIVTGGSMGIGRALARAWGSRGATLVLSARSADALGDTGREVEAAGGRAIVVPGDVTDEAHRRTLIDRAVAEGGSIDVLVNNAGRGFYSPASKIELDELRRLFELNVYAPLRLSQLALPHLERARGTVVMMSSIAGVVAAPRYGAYAATKFALEALSMAMRAELAESGVRVVVVRPGPVRTSFRAHAARADGEVGYYAPSANAQSVDEVAAKTLRAVDRACAVVETSPWVAFASATARIAPPAVRLALRRMASRSPR